MWFVFGKGFKGVSCCLKKLGYYVYLIEEIFWDCSLIWLVFERDDVCWGYLLGRLIIGS